MIYDFLVLGVAAKTAKDAIDIERLKSKEMELTNDEKREMLVDNNRRFIHFTSKESAEKILQSGFLIPTKGIIKNHFTKDIDNKGKRSNSQMVYMFDSRDLDIDSYIRNLPRKQSPNNGIYEFYAVSHKPNEYEINNFRRRVQDGAITYNGRLDIDGTDTRVKKYILGLDEQGEYTFNEVPFDFEYKPSDELLQKINSSKKDNVISYNLKMYLSEVNKNKEAFKTFKANKEEYKRQIREKRNFAKANKQFIEEQKDINYVFEQDGKKIVVKNLEYEVVDGKKLQKLAIIGNGFDDKNKTLKEVTKTCYMDEFDIGDIPKDDAAKYFFNNYSDMLNRKENDTRYIGLPLKNMETGELTNEYDEKFKKHYDKKLKTRSYSEYNQEKMNSKKIFGRIKKLFNRVIGKKEEKKMLNEPNSKTEDREKLKKLGYSSVEAMNNDDPNMVVLRENELREGLSNLVYRDDELKKGVNVKSNGISIEENEIKIDENQVVR